MDMDSFDYGILNEACQALKDAITLQGRGTYIAASVKRERYDELMQKIAEHHGVSLADVIPANSQTALNLNRLLKQYDANLAERYKAESVPMKPFDRLDLQLNEAYQALQSFGPDQDVPYTEEEEDETSSVTDLFEEAFQQLMIEHDFEPEDILDASIDVTNGELTLDVMVRRHIQVTIGL